jgi:hypothetical protein
MYVDESHAILIGIRCSWFRYGKDSHNLGTFLAELPNSIKTVSYMSSLFLALVLHPQVQKRAQAELDIAVGRDRLPTFDDRPQLPYIDAICRELVRWQMVTPMGSTTFFKGRELACEMYHFQGFPTHQLRTMFTEAFSFRKVSSVLIFRSSLR